MSDYDNQVGLWKRQPKKNEQGEIIDDPNKKSISVLYKEMHTLNEKISSIESLISTFTSKKHEFDLKLKKIKTTKQKDKGIK